jgi:hypothetical protein
MLSHGFTLFWFVMGAVVIGLGLIHRMALMTTPGIPGDDLPGSAEVHPDKANVEKTSSEKNRLPDVLV